jgi:hypothetical protein
MTAQNKIKQDNIGGPDAPAALRFVSELVRVK